MNKLLRLSFFSLFSLISTVTFAQTIIWSEDWSTATKDQTPAEVNANYTSTDGGSKTKIYIENLAGGTAPELLVSKNKDAKKGSFSAKISLNGASGDMKLRYKANQTNLKVVSPTTGVTVGDRTNLGGNDYEYPITVASGTAEMTLAFENTGTSTNVRLDDIKLFQGTLKSPAGLSWGTASRSVTLGADDNNFPTLANNNNLPVTYSSSETGIATIEADGTITLVAPGKTTIAAAFAGNDEFEAQTVSYELTVLQGAPTTGKGSVEDPYTASEVLALDQSSLPTYDVYISGTISEIKEVYIEHKNATYYISNDGTTGSQLQIYRGKYLGKADFTATDQIKVGDKVVVVGKIIVYKDELEVAQNNYLYSLNGTTGIRAIQTTQNNDAPLYNAAGQRVSNNYKGLVIKNGKKYMNK